MGYQHLCPYLPAAEWAVHKKMQEWSVNMAKKDAHHRAVLNGCLQHISIWRGNHKQRHPWVPFATWTVDISTPVLHAMRVSLDSSLFFTEWMLRLFSSSPRKE